jgi:hypothetical protein
LGSLAPYDAGGLNWKLGMADSDVRAGDAEADLGAMIARLNEQAGQARNDSESLLKSLAPELPGHDKNVIEPLRRMASIHVPCTLRVALFLSCCV